MPQKRGKQKPPGSMEPDDASSSDGLGSNRKVAVMSAAAASPGGKKKVEEEGAGSGGAGTLAESVKQARLKAVPSVAEFKYNKRRVRLVSQDPDLKEGAQGILYWMSRDQRVQDNWAFLYAQRLALKQKLPLHICFCLVPKFLEATIRHFGFLLRGLKEVAEECKELSVPFHLLVGFAKDLLPPFVTQHGIGGVVTDFAPLRVPMQWVENVRARLPPDVPFVQGGAFHHMNSHLHSKVVQPSTVKMRFVGLCRFESVNQYQFEFILCLVDAHNIVPCWVASDKQEYGARTIRRKIHDRLAEFLTEFPPVIKHPYPAEFQAEPVDWDACYASLQVDRSVKEVDWAQPGTASGLAMLEEFMKERLKFFGTDRNNPNQAALSNLSPWFHFGQISVQRAILEVCKLRSRYKESVESFIEEAVVRRELADNFCYYNQNYDKVEGAYDWAKTTLKLHAKDKRPHLYMLKQLEEGKTHDPLWNAAQLQMVHEGKMHGFLRMYWAKKILEWTTSPEEALEFSIYLNDRYELDGRDPNGYVGCMWSICGIHDQGWAERAVFGKIRYMNYAGCKRKFDVDQFECKYNPRKFSQQPLRSNNSKGKWRSKAGNAVPVKGCSSSRGK